MNMALHLRKLKFLWKVSLIFLNFIGGFRFQIIELFFLCIILFLFCSFFFVYFMGKLKSAIVVGDRTLPIKKLEEAVGAEPEECKPRIRRGLYNMSVHQVDSFSKSENSQVKILRPFLKLSFQISVKERIFKSESRILVSYCFWYKRR